MSFTIAHLSDPHLSPAPFPGGRELRLKRFLGWVNWKRARQGLNDMPMLAELVADLRAQKPDHVVMTGDAVNLGLRSEFARAAEWMAGLGDDVSFTPGNHDAYVRDAIPTLERTFAPWTEDFAFPYLKVRGDVALIGLNSGRPTAPFLATGRLGRAQLIAFGRMLKETAERGLARVVLVHHPPLRGGKAPRWRGLDDAAEFETVVGKFGAELVLHGHTHRAGARRLPSAASRNVAGFVPVLCAPSASAGAPDALHRACYYLITLEREAELWRTTWRARGMVMGGRAIGEREPPSV